MLLLMNALGDDYIVWDQAGDIRFITPGRGTVAADLSIGDGLLNEIRSATASGEKHLR